MLLAYHVTKRGQSSDLKFNKAILVNRPNKMLKTATLSLLGLLMLWTEMTESFRWFGKSLKQSFPKNHVQVQQMLKLKASPPGAMDLTREYFLPANYFQDVHEFKPVNRFFSGRELIRDVDFQLLEDGVTVKGFGLQPTERIVGVSCFLPFDNTDTGIFKSSVGDVVLTGCPSSVRVSHDYDLTLRTKAITDNAMSLEDFHHFSVYPVEGVKNVDTWSDIVNHQCQWTPKDTSLSATFDSCSLEDFSSLSREHIHAALPNLNIREMFLFLQEHFYDFSPYNRLLANDVMNWIVTYKPGCIRSHIRHSSRREYGQSGEVARRHVYVE